MTSLKADRLVTANGVRKAAERILGHAIRTPLLENEMLNDAAGGRVLVKAEVLQLGGAFKFRGAFNLISQLDAEQRKKGVLAWSSGNHAQGVARAARHFKTPAIIVMPSDAPGLKLEQAKKLGAEIVFYDRYTENREAIGTKIIEETGRVLAPPYDHPDIIEGQGTLALECVEDAREKGLKLDGFIVPCGGGGLTAGCGTILADISPATELWAAEPVGYDETWASIQKGERITIKELKPTICDAIATPSPGMLTFPINEKFVRGGVSLTEDEVGQAMIFAYKYLKLVVEPGGAVALAAILTGKYDGRGKVTAVTLSGGNVDPALFSTIVQNGEK